MQPEPDKLFVAVGESELTFADVDHLVSVACARILARRELRPGDKVALLMPSPLPFALALLALMRLRALSVPLNTRLTARELAWQVKNADCQLVLCLSDTLAQASNLDADVLLWPGSHMGQPSSAYSRYGTLKLDEDFAIIHTSGTTGNPKAAVLTGGNIHHSALASASRLGQMPDDRWLCVLPLYHVGGLSIILRSLIYGTAVEFGPTAPFDIQRTNRILSDNPITIVSLVPTMLQRLLDARTRPWNPHLRLILLGGEAPSADLLVRCAAQNLPIATCYGLTETASHVITALPQQVYQKPGTVGKPMLAAQVRIIDEGGADAPPNVPGEILVAGGSVMRGYYQDPAATAKALRSGWLHTGDIGYLDQDGDLFVLQRRQDLIVSGGENVYPAEVEAILRQHPAVAEAAVLGLPDPQWGQRVAAVIETRAGQSTTADDIAAFARQHLAGYKIPRQIAFLTALPRTASGKIQRHQARKSLHRRLIVLARAICVIRAEKCPFFLS